MRMPRRARGELEKKNTDKDIAEENTDESLC